MKAAREGTCRGTRGQDILPLNDLDKLERQQKADQTFLTHKKKKANILENVLQTPDKR